MRPKFLALVGLIALAGLLVGCAGTTSVPTPTDRTADPPGVTSAAPDEVRAAVAGGKGKVVLVECWATWCGPCVASFPDLVAKHRKYADKGLVVFSLSTDNPADATKVSEFLARQSATFTNFLLRGGRSDRAKLLDDLAYGGGIPHAALFGRSGERAWAGHPMDDELDRRIVAELGK